MPDSVTDVLGALAPVLAATGGIVAGLVALTRNAPRLRRMFGSSDQTQILVELRELAETRLEMISELKGQLAVERDAHTKDRDDLAFAQRSADEAYRRLNDLHEKLFLERRT